MSYGCLLFILLPDIFLLAASFELPMRPIYYFKGVVDPSRDPLSSDVIDGCQVVVTRQGTHCSGQECRTIPQRFPKDNITVLTIKYTVIEKIMANSFSKHPYLESLDIIQSRVTHIEDNAFAGLEHLRVLNLAVNEITHLSSAALNGLRNLRELVLMKNGVTAISDVLPAILPSVLPSLSLLDFSNNRLTFVNKTSFAGMEESPLRFLILLLCDLQDIHPEAFKPLQNLSGVMFRGNDRLRMKTVMSLFENDYNQHLKEVDISAMTFSRVPTPLLSVLAKKRIRVLFMASMRFSQIFVKQFPPMPHLEVLYLNNDRIVSIENGSLSNLTNLKEIYLKRNIMTELSESLLLPSLEVLDVSGFPAQILRFAIRDCAFRNMNRLKNLSMSYKSLSIRKDTFCGLSNLKRLVIRKCGINTIEKDAFHPLSSLEHLDISGNELFQSGNVEKLMFDGLQSTLKFFIAQDIGMDDTAAEILKNMNNVEVLDLSNNTLTSLNFLSGNPNLTMLTTLNLPFNFITKWDDSVVVDEVNLESVDLSHNEIRSVTQMMMDDFDTLVNLNLSHNPFRCGCEISPFVEWLNQTNVTVYQYLSATAMSKSRQEDYVCSGPPELAHTPLYKLPNILNGKCHEIKHNKMPEAILISLSVLLMLILGSVFVMYLFRKHLVYYWTRTKTIKEGAFQYDAFVSYSAVDSQWVFDSLLPRLENTASNLRLCVYDRDFLAGNAITDCILESIRKSRKIILVISNNFLLSPWCRLETELASHILVDEKRDGLLLIKMEELKSDQVSSQLKFLLQTRLHLTWSQDVTKQQDFWNKLQRALQIQTPFQKKGNTIV